MPEQNDDATVSYSVRELLSGMRNDMATGLARIESALVGKADKSDIARLEGRLDGHEARLESLEAERDERRGTRRAHEKRDALAVSGKRWAVDAVLTLGIIVATILAVIHP